MLRRLKGNSGFTLIELLIVVVILGVLIAIVIGATSGNKAAANDTSRQADLARIQTKLEEYYADNQAYPAALDAIADSFDDGAVPTDPKNSGTYVYTYTPAADNMSYTLTAQMEKAKNGTNIDANGLMTLINKQ